MRFVFWFYVYISLLPDIIELILCILDFIGGFSNIIELFLLNRVLSIMHRTMG